MRQVGSLFMVNVVLGLIVALPVAGLAVQRQQGVGIKDGECEVVSVGNYYCKVNGKCYYCTDSQGKNCYQETKCDSAVSRPEAKGGMVRPPTGMNAPILRRGVETGSAPTSPTVPEEQGK